MNPPIVSVVIPCYQQGQYLAECVNSVLSTKGVSVEAIIIDDGSSDQTPAVASTCAADDRVRYIRQENAGVGAARNAGLQIARGHYVHFLDADDMLQPDTLREHVTVMETTGADVTCSGWITVGVKGHPVQTNEPPDFSDDPFHALLPVNLAPPLCYLFKRGVVASIGGFDKDRRVGGHADWDMLLRIAATGQTFDRAPRAIALYRQHPGAMSLNLDTMYDSARIVLHKIQFYHHDCDECRNRIKLAVRNLRIFYLRTTLLNPTMPRLWHMLLRLFGDPTFTAVLLSSMIRFLKGQLLGRKRPDSMPHRRGAL